MKKRVLWSAAIFLIGIPTGTIYAEAEENLSQKKNQYHLFNPTPQELMREMSTDRPDKTESAYTVDAGHYQIEMSVLGYDEKLHHHARCIRCQQICEFPCQKKVRYLNPI